MRIALIIVGLAAIAVALVHIRRAETSAHHEIEQLEIRQAALRRRFWPRQIQMERLKTPAEVDRRADQMALDLIHGREGDSGVAQRHRQEAP